MTICKMNVSCQPNESQNHFNVKEWAEFTIIWIYFSCICTVSVVKFYFHSLCHTLYFSPFKVGLILCWNLYFLQYVSLQNVFLSYNFREKKMLSKRFCTHQVVSSTTRFLCIIPNKCVLCALMMSVQNLLQSQWHKQVESSHHSLKSAVGWYPHDSNISLWVLSFV